MFHVKQTAIGRRIHGRRAVAKGEGTGHIGVGAPMRRDPSSTCRLGR